MEELRLRDPQNIPEQARQGLDKCSRSRQRACSCLNTGNKAGDAQHCPPANSRLPAFFQPSCWPWPPRLPCELSQGAPGHQPPVSHLGQVH